MSDANPEHDRYRSPLAGRYAGRAMQAVWSDRRKFTTWRKLWLALAEAQQQLGLNITNEQLDALRRRLDEVDYAAADAYEKKLRHDVMAHVHALGDQAPQARSIIHLGATSQFVNCNTELLQIRDALRILARRLATVVDRLGRFAAEHRERPTLAFTHYQPAQPTTVGKRTTLWAYDLALGLEEIEHRLAALRFRGAKGATGTQASFLSLFHGDHDKVEQLDRLVTEKMGFDPDHRFAVTGQTYPRVVDAQTLGSLAAVAAVVCKICNDLRLLANRKELEEPFEPDQIGSSAMAYKRNPMRCERATGLARFVINQAGNATMTAATQWFERTLDDSSNRRLALPEAFLALDGSLRVLQDVADGLVVYPQMIRRNLEAELPFLATEDLMMSAVSQGADRQDVHELIRRHSQAAARRVKEEGADNDLLTRLRAEPMFQGVDLEAVLDPSRYVGRAPEQVDAFLAEVVDPIRKRYAGHLDPSEALEV